MLPLTLPARASRPRPAPEILAILRDNVENTNWRVRRAVLRALPGVTKVVGDFEADLLAKYVAGFADPIARVREACAALVEPLREGWGVDWVFKHVLTPLEPKSMDARWCVRWARLKAWGPVLHGSMSADVVSKAVEVLVRGACLLYTSPSPRDQRGSRMPSSA